MSTDKQTEDTLVERTEQYGTAGVVADISIGLLEKLQEHPNYKLLTPVMKMSLHMIFNKIGREVSGQARKLDTWTDIAGYANLVRDDIRGWGPSIKGSTEPDSEPAPAEPWMSHPKDCICTPCSAHRRQIATLKQQADGGRPRMTFIEFLCQPDLTSDQITFIDFPNGQNREEYNAKIAEERLPKSYMIKGCEASIDYCEASIVKNHHDRNIRKGREIIEGLPKPVLIDTGSATPYSNAVVKGTKTGDVITLEDGTEYVTPS